VVAAASFSKPFIHPGGSRRREKWRQKPAVSVGAVDLLLA
jgi:hypothetical protein